MRIKYFAELLSLLFHPAIFFLIMPFLIVYRDTENSMSALKWELFSLVFISLACFFTFFEKTRGIFSDWDLSKKDERYRFYSFLLLCGIVYIGVALYFRGVFFPMSLIALGIVIGILVFDFFNRYIKASIHISVSCAFVLTIGLLYGMKTFMVLFWIVPLLGWSRLKLKKHTIAEMVAGGMLGSLITLSTFFVGKSL